MENQANIMGYYLINLHEMAYHFGATYIYICTSEISFQLWETKQQSNPATACMP